MKTSLITLTYAVIAVALQSTSAQAQTTANYTWSITNNAAFQVYQYDVPTQTGMLGAPWVTPNILSANGGTATGTAQTQNSYSSGTSYIGTTLGSPYNHEFECQFTVNGGQVNPDGTCTAPTPAPAVRYGTGGTKPICTTLQSAPVVQTGPCSYTINFIFGFQ